MNPSPTTRRALALTAAGALLTTGCGGSTHATQKASAPGGRGSSTGSAASARAAGDAIPADLKRFYDQKPNWKPCVTDTSGPGWTCAKVDVPLDYSDPAKGSTYVMVTRRAATGPANQRVGSLLLNPGGPGGAGIEYAQDPEVVTKNISAHYDLVGFDPRGVGQSDPVRCLSDDPKAMDAFVATDPMPRTEAQVAEVVKQAKTIGAACQDKSGRILPYVGTPNAARDMDVIRGVLGDDKLHYLGKSYGTYLGAVYAGLFPQRTGRLVLDGAIDPTLSAKQMNIAQAQGFEKLIREFATDCTTKPKCPLGTDPNKAVGKLMSYLQSLQDHPASTRDGDRTVNYALGLTAVLQVMYVPQYWSDLREALSAAMAGDGSRLLQWADLYNDRTNGVYDNQTDANIAINCLDRPDPDARSAQQIQDKEIPDYKSQAPLLGEMLAWADLSCATWPTKPQTTPAPITAPGSAPILVVGTKDDPATPYPWAQGLAKQLQNGHLLTFTGSGHTAYTRGSQCIDNAVDAYLLQGTVPANGITCDVNP
ncbi:alpha/beta hydrolase [Catenulispora subtropica]|uniref:Alpha/beta hydrolase n=1 Tax=Catenulispora subtropica TaxID=450798 RepID=A0ABN2SN73_9ACTN